MVSSKILLSRKKGKMMLAGSSKQAEVPKAKVLILGDLTIQSGANQVNNQKL